ncbi:MAG: oxidoreductase [Pseudomonadota bacterium]|nr:oxidoreductase [Pseudomonadota bacterium]
MSKRCAIVIGSTGLVGRALLEQLVACQQYQQIYSVSRRPLATAYASVTEIVVPDFAELSQALGALELRGADAFSTLGTTQKQAGSKERFRAIDYGYNLSFAEECQTQGVKHYLLLSATGAKPNSRIFYNRVKGELERSVALLGFEQISLFQPSLLMGEHQDSRLGEGLAQRAFKIVKPIVPENWDYRPIEAARVAAAMLHIAIESPIVEDNPHVYSNRDMLELTLEREE